MAAVSTQKLFGGNDYPSDKVAGYLHKMPNESVRLFVGRGKDPTVLAVSFQPYRAGIPLFGMLASVSNPRPIMVIMIPSLDGKGCSITGYYMPASMWKLIEEGKEFVFTGTEEFAFLEEYTFAPSAVVVPPAN